MSRIVVAFDPGGREGIERWRRLSEELCGEAAFFKVGVPFLIAYGTKGIEEVRRACEAPIIADMKLADVAHVMVSVATMIPADAVIAHAFIGRKGALDELKRALDAQGKRLILVASMSHEGSTELIDENLGKIIKIIEEIEPWGVVAPATRPRIIRALRSAGIKQTILSPGVGAQGAEPGSAILAGADYEIIGRYITASESPRERARAIRLIHEQIVRMKDGVRAG